jgi:hypothetical protein
MQWSKVYIFKVVSCKAIIGGGGGGCIWAHPVEEHSYKYEEYVYSENLVFCGHRLVQLTKQSSVNWNVITK